MSTKLLVRKSREMFALMTLSIVSFLASQEAIAQTVTTNSQGTHGGYFYSFWEENGANQASMTLYPDGRYTTTWNNVGNFTAGKGWAVGKKDRVVCFEGSYDGGNNGFLAVYGWTQDPLVEYYVVESHGQWDPPGNTSDIEQFGSFESDGGTYDLYTSLRTNKPSIVGNATFQQFWSVRRTKRATGTVTFENHVNEWEKYGVVLGTTWDYQIMESEGYGSSGSSDITVWECETCDATAPEVSTTNLTYELNDVSTQLSAIGSNLTWYSSSSPTTPLASAPIPSTSEVGVTKFYVTQTPNNCESPKTEITVTVAQTYKILKVTVAPVIDGVIDNQWINDSIDELSADKILVGSLSNSTDLSGTAKLLWDEDYIYLLANVIDDTKINDSDNSYEDDAVELYFDINNDKASSYGANDVQYSFGWNDGIIVGALPADRSTAGIEYAVLETTDGYLVEARIPWTTLQIAPMAGQFIGIDFMINDDDDGTERDSKLSWNAGEDQAWQDPSLFGTAKLDDTELVTGIKSVKNVRAIIYPNPVKGQVFVDGLKGTFGYTISDNTGNIIVTGKTNHVIDVLNIESGIYILQVTQSEYSDRMKIIIE